MNVSIDVKELVIKDLHRRLGRAPKAQELVDEVRPDPDHVLYELFGFDDIEGSANKHWLYVARRIISEVKLMITTTVQPISAVVYVHDTDTAPGEQGYVEVAAIDSREKAERTVDVEIANVITYFKRGLGIAAQLNLEQYYRDEVEKELAKL
jgi:hypothetical protein